MTYRTGLYRSRTDRVLGGVAGGIAQSLNTDSSLIRILFVLLVIFAGGGVLLYLILWIALPEEDYPFYQSGRPYGEADKAPEGPDENAKPKPWPDYQKRNDGALIAGIILIVLGGAFLLHRLLPRIHFGDWWPAILVLAGVIIIFSSLQTKK